MKKDRGMTIFFNDGTKTSFSFPKQVTHEEFAISRIDKILERNTLVIEADGALMVIPFSSIKYLQLHGTGQKLPDFVVKEATVDA